MARALAKEASERARDSTSGTARDCERRILLRVVSGGRRPGLCPVKTHRPGSLDCDSRSPVAQLAEHPAVNRRVVGSSPTRGVRKGPQARAFCVSGVPMGCATAPEVVRASHKGVELADAARPHLGHLRCCARSSPVRRRRCASVVATREPERGGGGTDRHSTERFFPPSPLLQTKPDDGCHRSTQTGRDPSAVEPAAGPRVAGVAADTGGDARHEKRRGEPVLPASLNISPWDQGSRQRLDGAMAWSPRVSRSLRTRPGENLQPSKRVLLRPARTVQRDRERRWSLGSAGRPRL